MGTTLTVLGVLNFLVGVFGLLACFSSNGQSDKTQGMIISISAFSGMLGCFVIATVLHLLREIALRLEKMQETMEATAARLEITK